jgi:hypothetical protein
MYRYIESRNEKSTKDLTTSSNPKILIMVQMLTKILFLFVYIDSLSKQCIPNWNYFQSI